MSEWTVNGKMYFYGRRNPLVLLAAGADKELLELPCQMLPTGGGNGQSEIVILIGKAHNGYSLLQILSRAMD